MSVYIKSTEDTERRNNLKKINDLSIEEKPWSFLQSPPISYGKEQKGTRYTTKQ